VSDADRPPRHADAGRSAAAQAAPTAPQLCALCRRPLAGDEATLLLMRDGRPVAAYHERCHPHYRRGGCSAC
jgi:hypothetical protein